MVASFHLYSELKIQSKLKNGSGCGAGSSYKPWLTVQEFTSSGRSHRSLFNKSSRVLHLFSDLEFIYSCLFDWSPSVTDCRERYPLLRDDVQSISEELSIPVISYEGVQQVRFSDFLIDDAAHPLGQYAVDIRYLSDLKSNGAIETLELQRRYWEMKNIGFYVATEKNLPAVVIENTKWLLPAEKDSLIGEDLLKQYSFLKEQSVIYSDYRLIEFAKKVDTEYQMGLGETLRSVRSLMAKRIISFDIRTPIQSLCCRDLVFRDESIGIGFAHVAN